MKVIIAALMGLLSSPALSLVQVTPVFYCPDGEHKTLVFNFSPESSGAADIHIFYYLPVSQIFNNPKLELKLSINGKQAEPWDYLTFAELKGHRGDYRLYFDNLAALTQISFAIENTGLPCSSQQNIAKHKGVLIMRQHDKYQAAEYEAPYLKDWHLKRLGF